MLAVMEPNTESPQDPVSEFLVTGRTGRRNAMADILGPHATTSSGDLPERLQTLTTVESESTSTTVSQSEVEPKSDGSSAASSGPPSSTVSPDQSQQIGNS